MTQPGPTRQLLGLVFGALMLLLLLTAAAAKIDLGIFNVPVALLIAAGKTALIFLFFMHLKYQQGLVRLFALSGFFWLAIMGLLTFADYLTRGSP
jgi:cytochrome c oxidase subunit 4